MAVLRLVDTAGLMA